MHYVENSKIVEAIKPQASNNAPEGDWVSLKNYRKALIICQKSGGHASANTFSVRKATSVAGAGAAAVTVTNWYLCDDTTVSDTLVKQAASASLATGATAKPAVVVAEINADEIAGYDCLQVNCAAGNAGNIVSAVYVLLEPRYAQATPPSAIVD